MAEPVRKPAVSRLLRELLSQADAYEVVSFDKSSQAPKGFAALQPAW